MMNMERAFRRGLIVAALGLLRSALPCGPSVTRRQRHRHGRTRRQRLVGSRRCRHPRGPPRSRGRCVVIAKRAHAIALQSIAAGLAMSGVAMGLAAFGWLTPVAGALTQEAIDVAVILNALRALVPAQTFRH